MRVRGLAVLHQAILLGLGLGLGVAACSDRVLEQGGDEGPASNSGAGDDDGTPICAGAEPILLEGVDSGYRRCPDDTIHRAEAIACGDVLNLSSCAGTESFLGCTEDSECGSGPLDRCISQSNPYTGESQCLCSTACMSDEDCGSDEVCLCPGIVGKLYSYPTCEKSNCRDGSDCASGECGVSSWFDGCSQYVGLACRTAEDECRLDEDCPQLCRIPRGYYGETFTEWACEEVDCYLGRPLHCEDGVRMASVVARGDWSDGELLAAARGLAATLTTSQREAARAHWTTVARMEHASVASFARFTLDLMTFGAPPELLALAQQAAADEVRHAQLAFAVASSLADDGEDASRLGPGPMRLHLSLIHI